MVREFAVEVRSARVFLVSVLSVLVVLSVCVSSTSAPLRASVLQHAESHRSGPCNHWQLFVDSLDGGASQFFVCGVIRRDICLLSRVKYFLDLTTHRRDFACLKQ